MTEHELHSRATANHAALDWPRIQAISGLYFAAFLTLHIGATISAVFGESAFTFVQHAGRRIYQFPIVEVGLIAAFTMHLVSAWKLRHRARAAVRSHARRRLHRYAGIYLVLFVAGHALATRGVSLAGNVDSGFDAVAFSIAWVPAWFLPYYFLLAMAGLYHAWWGSLTALARLGWQAPGALRTRAAFWLLPAAGLVLIPLALARFAGLFGDIGSPMESEYARYYLALFGLD
jgi:succinate dehydrogenase/fumarate reductase cytochrome b subunit